MNILNYKVHRQLIEGGKLYALFAKMNGAYDTANQGKLMKELRRREIGEQLSCY